jgi:hypothetical protein
MLTVDHHSQNEKQTNRARALAALAVTVLSHLLTNSGDLRRLPGEICDNALFSYDTRKNPPRPIREFSSYTCGTRQFCLVPDVLPREVAAMSAQKDRRATQRFLPKAGNRLTYGSTSGEIRDLSLEGVFVFDPDPLPVGSEVALTLRAGNQDIALEGIVRHSAEQQGMGIQFTNVSSVSKRRLIIYIASLFPAPSQTVKS